MPTTKNLDAISLLYSAIKIDTSFVAVLFYSPLVLAQRLKCPIFPDMKLVIHKGATPYA